MPSPRRTRNILEQLLVSGSSTGIAPSDLDALGINSTVEALPIAGENALASLVCLRITTTEDHVLVDDVAAAATKEGGSAIAAIPPGLFIPLAVSLVGTLSLSAATATTSAGEISIGTAQSAGTSATIGGAAEEDILDGQALTNFAANTPQAIAFAARAQSDFIDGSSGLGIYVNATITNAVAQTDLILEAGAVIRIYGLLIDDDAIGN